MIRTQSDGMNIETLNSCEESFDSQSASNKVMSIGDMSFSKRLLVADVDMFFQVDKKEKIQNQKFFDQPHVTIIDDDFVGETKNIKRKVSVLSNSNNNISILKRSNVSFEKIDESTNNFITKSKEGNSDSRKSLK